MNILYGKFENDTFHKMLLTLIDWEDDCESFRKNPNPPFLVMGDSIMMKL